MAYTTLLVIHILGACITGIVASSAGVIMWQRQDSSYRKTAVVLGALGGFELFTGVLLSIISPNITAISLCANIIAYVLTVLFVEMLLFLKMKNISMIFPIARALSPILTGLTFLQVAIAYGF